MSSLYARYVAPRLIHFACGTAMVAAQRQLIVPQAEGVVLEIGIGSGHNLQYYDPQRVRKVVGVDPSGGILKLGAARFADQRLDVEILQAPAEAIPLDDASADTAVVTYTLCSVDDAARTLGEVRRVLKPSGRVLILEHGRADSATVARWQDRLNPLWRPVAAGCNINRPVVELFRQAGFSIETMETFYLPGVPKPVGFHYRGSARPR